MNDRNADSPAEASRSEGGSSRSKFPPGPKGHLIFGCLREKWSEPNRFFQSNRDNFGDIASFRLGPIRVFQLNSPALIREHFHTKSEFCIRGLGFEKLHPVLGQGLFTAEGREWSNARKLFKPHYSNSPVSLLEPVIRRIGSGICTAIPDGARTDIKGICAAAALQVVFSSSLPIPWQDRFIKINELTERIKNCAQHQIHSFYSRWQRLPSPNNRVFWQATRELRALSAEIVEIGRRESPPESLLKQLIDLFDAGEISSKLLIDQVTTIVVTGHETVANTLCWGLELMAIHQSVQDKFAKAAQQKDLLQSPAVLEQVVLETIRLFPAAWIISHEVVKPHRIGGWEIPKRSLIFVLPYSVHRDPKLWADAESYKPERFSKLNGRSDIPPYQFIPFGGGARHCIGSILAVTEIQLLLEELVKRFKISSDRRYPTAPEFSMTIKPSSPIFLTFSIRESVTDANLD